VTPDTNPKSHSHFIQSKLLGLAPMVRFSETNVNHHWPMAGFYCVSKEGNPYEIENAGSSVQFDCFYYGFR
jgi:hypothetical protein